MDRGDGDPCRDVGGERPVHHFVQREWRRHGAERVHVDELAVQHPKSRRRVHPRVGDGDEQRGRGAAHCHGQSSGDVDLLGNAVPAVQVDTEEDGLREERESLQRKRHGDERAGVLHEGGEEQPELERQDRARHGADGEEDRGAF